MLGEELGAVRKVRMILELVFEGKKLRGRGPTQIGPQRDNEGVGVELSRSGEPLDNSPTEGGE